MALNQACGLFTHCKLQSRAKSVDIELFHSNKLNPIFLVVNATCRPLTQCSNIFRLLGLGKSRELILRYQVDAKILTNVTILIVVQYRRYWGCSSSGSVGESDLCVWALMGQHICLQVF